MDSFDRQLSQSGNKWMDFIAPEILISLATGPLLLGLVGGKALLVGLREVGELSEEIFRGDRLPLLNFPVTSDSDPDSSTTN
ncbi:hypothetical protein [Leptothermofonsia sp. ETS-13]|uniref:hypothetical protein n=1 Tax=Leptothermofonsia sp. ETS-13 TaxID=3035696 RepID=UPI003BA28852